MARSARKKGLQPSVIKETENLKISITKTVLEEAKEYADFVGIQSIDEVVDQALEYVFKDDTEWQKIKKERKKEAVA